MRISLPSRKPGSSPPRNICRTFSALQPHRSPRVSGVYGERRYSVATWRAGAGALGRASSEKAAGNVETVSNGMMVELELVGERRRGACGEIGGASAASSGETDIRLAPPRPRRKRAVAASLAAAD